jgi:hypothetical protein
MSNVLISICSAIAAIAFCIVLMVNFKLMDIPNFHFIVWSSLAVLGIVFIKTKSEQLKAIGIGMLAGTGLMVGFAVFLMFAKVH